MVQTLQKLPGCTKWIMWDSIILRFSPVIAIYSMPLWNKNPIKWLKDIDTRIQHKQHLWNYHFYGFRMHFESGIILCIFLWKIILLTVIALLWSHWNKIIHKPKHVYGSFIGLLCLCCNYDSDNCEGLFLIPTQTNPPFENSNNKKLKTNYSAEVFCL